MYRYVAVTLLLLGLASASLGQTLGSGDLRGHTRLRIEGCGKARDPITSTFALFGAGQWSFDLAADTFLTGTSTTSGRVSTLALDAQGSSLATLAAHLGGDADQLCGTSVTINSLVITDANLKISKRGTRARLIFRASGTGVSSEGSSAGTYRLRAKGRWQP